VVTPRFPPLPVWQLPKLHVLHGGLGTMAFPFPPFPIFPPIVERMSEIFFFLSALLVKFDLALATSVPKTPHQIPSLIPIFSFLVSPPSGVGILYYASGWVPIGAANRWVRGATVCTIFPLTLFNHFLDRLSLLESVVFSRLLFGHWTFPVAADRLTLLRPPSSGLRTDPIFS